MGRGDGELAENFREHADDTLSADRCCNRNPRQYGLGHPLRKPKQFGRGSKYFGHGFDDEYFREGAGRLAHDPSPWFVGSPAGPTDRSSHGSLTYLLR